MRNFMQTGCLILGILCLAYFISILCLTGFSEWFECIWIFAGGYFLILWKLLAYQKQHPAGMIRLLIAAAGVLGAAAGLLIIIEGSRVVRSMVQPQQGDLDYVIILGARVRGDQPTRALKKRLDKALEYAEKNPDTLFILSGGQGEDEGVSEAQCMYDYLRERGIDAGRLLTEDCSTSTRENLRFSAALLNREKNRIGILSNNFHICRALMLARQEGYQQVCGIPASSDLWMQPHYILREITALVVLRIRGI